MALQLPFNVNGLRVQKTMLTIRYSVAGSAFDLCSCLYRYWWYYYYNERFEDADDSELLKIKATFKSHASLLLLATSSYYYYFIYYMS